MLIRGVLEDRATDIQDGRFLLDFLAGVRNLNSTQQAAADVFRAASAGKQTCGDAQFNVPTESQIDVFGLATLVNAAVQSLTLPQFQAQVCTPP